jgi:hypothetical protein
MPGYPESQIMVLDFLPSRWPRLILVIDMIIFSEELIHSEPLYSVER